MIGQNFVGARKAFFQQQVALKLCGYRKTGLAGTSEIWRSDWRQKSCQNTTLVGITKDVTPIGVTMGSILAWRVLRVCGYCPIHSGSGPSQEPGPSLNSRRAP